MLTVLVTKVTGVTNAKKYHRPPSTQNPPQYAGGFYAFGFEKGV